MNAAAQTDAADYLDAEEAMFSAAPHLVLNRALSVLKVEDVGKLTQLARLLRDEGFDATTKLAWVASATAALDTRSMKALSEAAPTHRPIVVFEWDQRSGAINRYTPWMAHPNAEYTIAHLRNFTQNQDKLTVMRNPWKADVGPHLGKLAARFGGGGHRGVGSLLAPSECAMDIQNQIQALLEQDLCGDDCR